MKKMLIISSLFLILGLSFNNEEYNESGNIETISPDNEKHPPSVI